MKFMRTVQLDASDQQVFQAAAVPGEWAVPGAFVHWEGEPPHCDGKARAAFRHGFVGTESFGYSTLVVIADISQPELAKVKTRIAQHLVERYGAPSPQAAHTLAEDEVHFAMELCEYPTGTLIAVQRSAGIEGVEEQFRVIKPNAANHEQVKLWAFVDD